MAGQRFDFHQSPLGMQGGLTLYPVNTVVDGLIVSSVAIGGTGNVNLTMNVSAGKCRLDGKYITSSAITGLTFVPGGDLNVGDRKYIVYLNPQRVIPASTSAPSSPSAGDKYIKVVEMNDHLQLVDTFEFKNSAWQKYSMVSAPPSYGHNNLPMNDIKLVIDTNTSNNKNFALASEKPIYHRSGYPVGLSSPGAAYLRQPSYIELATVAIANGGVITLTTYGDEVRSSI